MKTLLHTLYHRMASVLRERWYLQLEYIALQHQLEVLKRSAKRPRSSSADRCVWLLLSRCCSKWPQALEIMQADTVRRWQRQGLWSHVRGGRGRKRPGRPAIPAATRDLIRAMSRDNRLWGAPRLHGELAKLGINVSQTPVAKYMDQRPGPPSPSWRTFRRLHAPELLVREVYAELSGRSRAGYNRVIVVLRHALWRRVSVWLRRMLCPHVVPLTQAADPNVEPVSRPLDVVEMVRTFGRSPGCSAASSMWLWRPVFRHCVGGGKRADALRRRSRASLATFTQESGMTRILRHLKLASVPPPITPARLRQELLAFDEAHASVSP